MINFKNLLNSKIIALTAVVGITPLFAQSSLAESINTRTNSEPFKNNLLIAQEAVTNPGSVPTTTPGNIGDDPINSGGVEVPSTPDGVQINAPGSIPTNPTRPVNGINNRGVNSPDNQLNRGVNSPDNQLENGGVSSPRNLTNPMNNNGGVNSPGNSTTNDPGYIGVPAR